MLLYSSEVGQCIKIKTHRSGRDEVFAMFAGYNVVDKKISEDILLEIFKLTGKIDQ